jgi:alpha-glucosidase
MEPVTYFLTGMEKHSEDIRDDLYQDGQRFFDMMQENIDRFQWSSLQCAMNELSNHDHSRFLTRTNRTVGRTHTLGAGAADKGIDKAVMREAVVIQMTWPGAPTVYYGDEAGLTGWTDPDNRRCYPWGNEDEELIELHRSLIALRRRYPVLKTGSIIPLCSGSGWIAYARFDEKDCAIVACNNNDWPCVLTIDTRKMEAADGTVFEQVFRTCREGHSEAVSHAGTAAGGWLPVHISAKSAVILADESMMISR